MVRSTESSPTAASTLASGRADWPRAVASMSGPLVCSSVTSEEATAFNQHMCIVRSLDKKCA